MPNIGWYSYWSKYILVSQNSHFIWGKSKCLHEQFGSVFLNFKSLNKEKTTYILYIVSSYSLYIFCVIHEEFAYVFTNWILWWNFCHSVHNLIHESISWTFCRKLFMNVTKISNMKLVKNHLIKLILKQILTKYSQRSQIFTLILANNLRKHIIIIHKVHKNYKCDSCGKSFTYM